jgi:hypothetical protein
MKRYNIVGEIGYVLRQPVKRSERIFPVGFEGYIDQYENRSKDANRREPQQNIIEYP